MNRQVITFHYELKDNSGGVLESSRQGDPLAFLEGAGQIIPGLETALLELEKGKTKEVFVPYQDAYGSYDQTLVAQVPRNQFSEQSIKAGDLFQIPKGKAVRIVMVLEVTEETVTIDANHPLAGKDLTFVVEITDRREATPEEIAHGHVHPSRWEEKEN